MALLAFRLFFWDCDAVQTRSRERVGLRLHWRVDDLCVLAHMLSFCSGQAHILLTFWLSQSAVVLPVRKRESNEVRIGCDTLRLRVLRLEDVGLLEYGETVVLGLHL